MDTNRTTDTTAGPEERAGDYALVAEALRFVTSREGPPPTVGDIAEHLHVSPSHLRRLFGRWAGVSPKTFVQHVSAADARERLRRRTSAFETALEIGLSSAGRLHDLMVSVEAMTPGEVAARGAGTNVRAARHDTALGPAVIGVTERGVCLLEFPGADTAAPLEIVAERWPEAEVAVDPAGTAHVARLVDAALRGAFDREQPRIVLQGTNLQVQVWRALLRIPPGEVATYGDVAAAVGRPRAVRAVANAVGRNPVSVLIPCHRVIRSTGELGGYRWGLDRKRLLLAAEATHQP